MIPATNGFLQEDFEVVTQPSYTFKMHINGSRINGYTDEQDAMMQAIYCILNTERYQYLIYSWNYGVELANLVGEPISYVLPEIQRRISEALLWDERIIEVKDFSFSVDKNKVMCSFTAVTIFGEVQIEKAVNI